MRYVGGPLLVLAGAGSGKTSVITRKIAWLVETCGIAARHIAAVTFTNKAAREMKQRVSSMLPGSAGKGLTVCTFHHLGLRIIQREAALLERKSGFSIFDDQDSRTLLKELLLDQSDAADQLVDLCRQQISLWKNENQGPDYAASKAESPQEARLAEVYRRYQQALASYNAVDFDDLISLPVQLFEENPEALARWQKKIRYLLVDEYQDTNASQYRLVQLLLGDRNGLTVVGDDDQSIYAWRGAKPENLAQLHSDFPSLKVIKLEQNYRSTNRILRSANQLIGNNSHVYEKKLWSEKGLGEPIRVIQVGNEEIECERIGNEILEQKLQFRAHFKDFAVLMRSNHQAKLLELKFQAKQIPYQLTGGTSFFARTEIKDVMGYLRLMVNPDDDAAMLRVINVPRRKIGTSTLQTLGEYAHKRHCSLFSASTEIGLQQQMEANGKGNHNERLQKFSHWLQRLQRQIDNGQPLKAIDEMLNDIDYAGWLQQNSSSTKVAERRMDNVRFLVDCIAKELKGEKMYADNSVMEITGQEQDDLSDDNISDIEEDNEHSLEAVIKKLVLRDLLDQQSEEAADDKVQIMTLHASKGLEFPHVFIMGFEEELLPHRNSIESETIDEERRLAYVGITRAQQTLNLLIARRRKQFGELLNCEASRFLEELPKEDLQKVGFDSANDEAVNKEKGQQTLSSLKSMFE